MTEPFAIRHVSIVTGDETGTVVPGQTVLVGENGTIEWVGEDADIAVPSGYNRLDASGKYLTPGLINAHVHVFGSGKPLSQALLSPRADAITSAFLHSHVGSAYMKRLARGFLQTELLSGVTSLRTVGDTGYETVELASEFDSGESVGPRMLASGPLMAVTGGHGSPKVTMTSDSPWEARRNVRQSLRAGVTAIKIAATAGVTDARRLGEAGRPQMTLEEMAAICDEAHSAGLIVAAHAQSREGVMRALRAGVDTIEHGSSLTDEMIELFLHNPASLRGYTALIPTMIAALPLVRLPQSVTGITDIVHANAAAVSAEMESGLKTALAAGVVVGVGTDASCTYVTQYGTWRELDVMHRFGGMGAAAVLHAATQVNAQILGLADVTGSITAGKSADMVLLTKNPLDGSAAAEADESANFRAFEQPEAVIVRGRVLLHPRIERLAEIDAQLDTL
ncbi:MAG: amidohydrolase family protein [Bifidobacteriaceae bacterium]|nr:amidohydrolase family protein [Bifidobacteriaceae bacterium]